MSASLKLLPGSAVRWRGRRYLIVDYERLDAIIARQPGKRRLITESESIKEPRGRSRSQSYSQIALTDSQITLRLTQAAQREVNGADGQSATTWVEEQSRLI